MTIARVVWSTCVRIGLGDLYDVLVDVIFMGVVKMAIVQIVNMVAVLYRGVSAVFAMNMRVIRMGFAAHCSLRVGG